MARRSYTSKPAKQGEDAQPFKVEFELDGTEFVGDGHISIMDLSEFARLANDGMDSGSPEGLAILADVYLSLLGPAAYKQFRKHCREHGTDGGVLVEILGGLISDEADRPTERPSDSSAGPPSAPGTVTVVSFSQGTVEQRPVEEEPQVRSYG